MVATNISFTVCFDIGDFNVAGLGRGHRVSYTILAGGGEF